MSIYDKSIKNVAEAAAKIMDEALKGNQHKIDANKNNKVDAHDFKLLRSKLKVKKEEASPMIKPPSNRFDNKKDAFAHAKKNGGKVYRHEYINPRSGMKSTTFSVKEEVEPVNEVKVGDKVHVGMNQKGGSGFKGTVHKIDGENVHVNVGTTKYGDRIVKGQMKNVTKEEVEQIDELKTGTLLRYATKATKSLTGGDRSKENKRIKGIQLAKHKIQQKPKMKEEVEQVSELSTELLARYKTAAVDSYREADKRGDLAKTRKRFKGTITATNKQFANDLKKHASKQNEGKEASKLPPHLQKLIKDKNLDKVFMKTVPPKHTVKDVTPKGYGPTEEVELDEAIPKSTSIALVHTASKKIVAKGNKNQMIKK